METKVGRHYSLRLISDNLIEGSLEGKLKLDDAVTIVNSRKELGNGKPMKLLMYVDDVKSINSQALKYFSKEGNEELVASAMIVDKSIIANHLVNLFLGAVAKKPPLKIFKNRSNAMEWLDTV